MSNPTAAFTTDTDGDSQMTTSHEVHLATPSTPPQNRLIPSNLSPPDSQGGVTLPPSMPTIGTSGLSGANANGKRPLDSLDNAGYAPGSGTGSDAASLASSIAALDESLGAGLAGANGVGSGVAHAQQHKVQTHTPTGYSWSRAEDEPGYAWGNRKAIDEANRAWEQGIVAKDRTVGNRYGDPFEMAAREAAMLKQAAAAANAGQ